jgi:integrator complex subunit 3
VDHEETMMALLFSILTDPSLAHKSYSTLTLVTRDGMGVIIHVAELLVLEKLPKLLENTRIQVMS